MKTSERKKTSNRRDNLRVESTGLEDRLLGLEAVEKFPHLYCGSNNLL